MLGDIMDDTLGKDKSVEMLDKLKEETESIICDILEEGIKMDNIELLDKVVDIHQHGNNGGVDQCYYRFFQYLLPSVVGIQGTIGQALYYKGR